MNNCNTEEARQKAQEYYNKTVSLEKDLGKIQAVGEVTTQVLGLAQSILDENTRQKEIKKNIIISEDKLLFDALCYDILKTFENAGYKFDEIDGEKFEEGAIRILRFENFDVSVIALNWKDTKPSFFVKEIGLNDVNDVENRRLGFKNAFAKLLSQKPYKKYISKKSTVEISDEIDYKMLRIMGLNFDYNKLKDNYMGELDHYKRKVRNTIQPSVIDVKKDTKISPTPMTRFNLPNINPDKDKICLILVNFSFNWCEPCKKQYEQLKNLNENIDVRVIQIASNEKDLSADKDYFKSNPPKEKIYYVNDKEFNVEKLHTDGSLPALFFFIKVVVRISREPLG